MDILSKRMGVCIVEMPFSGLPLRVCRRNVTTKIAILCDISRRWAHIIFAPAGQTTREETTMRATPLWEYNLNKTYTERIIRSQLSSKLWFGRPIISHHQHNGFGTLTGFATSQLLRLILIHKKQFVNTYIQPKKFHLSNSYFSNICTMQRYDTSVSKVRKRRYTIPKNTLTWGYNTLGARRQVQHSTMNAGHPDNVWPPIWEWNTSHDCKKKIKTNCQSWPSAWRKVNNDKLEDELSHSKS